MALLASGPKRQRALDRPIFHNHPSAIRSALDCALSYQPVSPVSIIRTRRPSSCLPDVVSAAARASHSSLRRVYLQAYPSGIRSIHRPTIAPPGESVGLYPVRIARRASVASAFVLCLGRPRAQVVAPSGLVAMHLGPIGSPASLGSVGPCHPGVGYPRFVQGSTPIYRSLPLAIILPKFLSTSGRLMGCVRRGRLCWVDFGCLFL